MELDPQVPKYMTSDPTSFAYTSARERWPTILTGAIDDVHRAVGALGPDQKAKENEGKAIITGLAKLKYELQHNRMLLAIPFDGDNDMAEYNEELELRLQATWHNIEWLYAECYLYRRIRGYFGMSQHWTGYDVFSKQKMSTFKSSRPAVLELAARYRDIITQTEKGKNVVDSDDPAKVEAAEQLLFTEMMEICLWGNATDLSLLTSLTYEDIQKLQGSSARKAQEANILVNELPTAFALLNQLRHSGQTNRRVDIVLDNAGFELFVDLLLAGYLLATGLATEIVLHPKSIPWFVSDVLPEDFADLLSAIADPQSFYTTPDPDKPSAVAPAPLSAAEESNVEFLFEHWSGLHNDGKLILRPNRFWTAAGSFWRMPRLAPDLFKDLQQSELVIFKGDLNYRKLTGDAAWDPTTPFSAAIGPMARQGYKKGIRTLALRTCKADVVVGLPEGRDEEVRRTEGGGGDSGARRWAWNGKWAVVQFCDGRV